MSTHTQTLTFVAALADPAHRDRAVHALALHLGVEDLLLFITDPEIGILLPAPGFPQTLPQGRLWHTFLAECLKLGQHSGELPFPNATTIKRAIGFAVKEGSSAMVLLGGTTLSNEVTSVSKLLPLLEAAFRGERAVLTANAAANVAQQTAEQANTLANALDHVRSELQHTLAQTNTIIEAIPDAIFVCDTNNHIVRANANGAILFGLTTAQTPEPLPVTPICYPDARPVPFGEQPLIQALQGITRTDYRFMVHRDDIGQDIQLLVSAAPILNSIGEITGAVGVATDITELFRLERQKDEFLGIASHELRTPLTALKGLAQLTRRKLEKAHLEEAQYMVMMERSIARMDRLIKDLLDVSRIEANKLPLHLERCNLAELCRQVSEEQIVASSRSISLELPEQPVEVEVDPERIGQVLINLLSNALKYSQGECPVTLRLSQEADHALISVHDEGVGIPPEVLPNVFERFYRVSGTTVQSGSEMGLGLGLYICQTIISRHHGLIGVQSTPGQGSTFWFKLPLVPMA